MKHLNDVLKESLLDDEEDLMKNTDVAISLQKHPIWRFSKGWVILDPPQEMRGYGYNHQPNIFIGDKSHGDEWDPTELKLYKFQGLGAITIGSDADITSILKDIDCDYCGWLDIQNHKSKLIDLTKIGFPLTHLLRITTIEPVDIKAYNKHIGFVHLANSRYTSKICFTADNVKGWDCDYLVVDASYFTVDGPIAHGENKLNGFWIDRCQTLINNNPKAKEIYLYDRNLDVFFRLSTSGSKRILKNVVNRKKMLNRIYDHAIFQAKNQAEGWRYDGHQDLYESLLDDNLVDTFDELSITHFLQDNYQNGNKCQIRKDIGSNGKYIVDCNKGKLIVKNKSIISLTNGLFEFGIIKSDFICHDCTSLTSLEGAPKEVGGSFYCYNCTSLTSLEGAPKKVGWSFDCRNCTSLTSLEGAPKEVGGSFDCHNCVSLTSLEGAPKEVGKDFICHSCTSLTSLKGTPKEVGGTFNCSYCTSLTSLEGAPKKIGKNFYCVGSKGKFTKEEVQNIAQVKGAIM